MKSRYPLLLSPVTAGNHVLKNRLSYPNASPHTLMGPEKYPATGFRAFHVDLARNGAGIVTIAEWNNPGQHIGPYELDFTHMQSFDLSDPSVHNYYSLMAEEIHMYGSKLFVNASVDWPDGYALYAGPKFGPGVPPGTMVEALPKERFPEVIDGFLAKLRLYKIMGYDGFSMRCDMDLLQKGHRDDEYSGETIEGRSRFLCELYAAVKGAFGGDFLREATVAWEQPWGYGRNMGPGVTSDEVAEFCHRIDPWVDIFQVREKDGCRSHPHPFNFAFGDHPAVDFCARLKKEGITALLEPIGGFQEPSEMERYLQEGKCDMFGAARAFMADPEYLTKMVEGREEDITPCLKCNKCHGELHDVPKPWITMCSVNPRHGLKHELDRMYPPSRPKKVAVIGGGATGMRAAIEAAVRGHDVTLFEKSGVLGGQLLHADYFAFKWSMKNYKEWLIRQLAQKGVKVVMNCAPTPEQIEAADFDAVLAATGAVPSMPRGIEGLIAEDGTWNYPHCWQVWDKEPEMGRHVVIVGGSETGMETAIHLLRSGHDVTILTRQPVIAHDASRLHYITMSFVKQDSETSAHEAAEWERYDNLECIVNATTTKLEGNTVTYVVDGVEKTVTGDNVIICGGSKKELDAAMAYAGSAPVFYPIGDCIGAGNIQACNRDAFSRANAI